MLNLMIASLNRLRPHVAAAEPAVEDDRTESSWHTSSYELAQGLEVIEMAHDEAPVFADTMPAWYPPADGSPS